MRRSTASAGWAVAVLLLGLAAPAVRGEEASPARLPLGGATFGMTLEAWKELPPPPGADPQATRVCRDANRPLAVPGYMPGPEDRRADLETCAWVARLGGVALPQAAPLDGSHFAHAVRYLFADGRLYEVEFRASVDAYSDVIALLTRRFGPPTQTLRDAVTVGSLRLDRVRKLWRKGAIRVELTDPSADRSRLAVRLQLPAGGA